MIALCDGHFPLAAHEVLRVDHGPLDTLLERARLPAIVPSHVNAFLIDDGVHRTLIDAGAGDLQDTTLGQLMGALAAAGYQPADIDTVLVTHLHPDHVGGLTRRGQAMFTDATVYVAHEEAAFWLDRAHPGDVDASVRATFGHARDVIAPYQRAGRYQRFSEGATWHGRIEAISLPGHTPGHTGFRLHTGTSDIVFCGDLLHVASVQTATPGVTVCYDGDPTQAASTRKRFFDEMCRRGDIVGAAHSPFPALGYIEARDPGYAWSPLAQAR